MKSLPIYYYQFMLIMQAENAPETEKPVLGRLSLMQCIVIILVSIDP